jgi:protein-L-isoaspartate(D-aspartate) O-methyltransferase
VARGILERLFGVREGGDTETARARLVERVRRELGGLEPAFARALLEVPRARFVRPEDASRAYEDMPLPLDDEEDRGDGARATISAPHAYALSFALAELGPGDRLLELGAGTGYGAALAAHIVGTEGRVVTVEIDPKLAARAKELLRDAPNVLVVEGDAMTSSAGWDEANKVIVTFALPRIPDAWLERLPEAGVLVAPIGPREAAQRLVKVRRVGGELEQTAHSAVRYVANRGAST